MRTETAKELLSRCLRKIAAGEAGEFIENPAIKFTADAKAGDFDDLSDEEYGRLLNEYEDLSGLWNKQSRRTVGAVTLALLERADVPADRIERIAGQLAEWYVWPEPAAGPLPDPADVIDPAFDFRTPKEIRDAIAKRVIGQPEAARAAAMIVYNQLAGRRTNAIFCGPSGCGKSEIWRCLSREWPGLVRIVDASRLSADGWIGSMHVRDVFEGTDMDLLKRRGMIVVFDEADKILGETAVSSGGHNHNHLVQNNLLKMLDGDVIEFGAQDGKPGFSVDCGTVSVVMLGAFESLLAAKAAGSGTRHIGFGSVPEAAPPSHRDIGYGDLIKAGTRREIAGRINRIVTLDPLSPADYEAILRGPVLSGLERFLGCRISMDGAAAKALAEQAIASGLGVRWMKSAVLSAIDDAMFDAVDDALANPSGASCYKIAMRDGKLCCRAARKRPGSEAPAERGVACGTDLPF